MSHVHVYEHLIVALKVQLLEQHGRLSVDIDRRSPRSSNSTDLNMKNVARATRPEMVTHLFLHQLSHNATTDINAAVTDN